MCASNIKPSSNILFSVLSNKCPNCRRGKLFTESNPYNFKKMMDMPEHCSVCGQAFELETGFYFGTGYVSYGLSVAFIAGCFIIWFFTLGISIKDNSIFWWLGSTILLLLLIQPLLQRLSRSLWIAFFVPFTNGEHTKTIGD
jgi:uncharacterized protein (DUF983 family)